jgi:hypothetical protein
MGKKKSANKKKTASLPDEYKRIGPFELARFGTLNIFKSNLNQDNIDIIQKRFYERYPDVCNEIDEKIESIVKLIINHSPQELLRRAYWEKALRHMGKEREVEIEHEDGLSLRVLEYIQNIIASVPPLDSSEQNISEDDWQKLRGLIDDLFIQINHEYLLSRSAKDRKEGQDDLNYDWFLYKAQLYWVNIRGNRYTYHELPYYKDVLSPHADIIYEIYGITLDNLLEGLHGIYDSLTRGIGNLLQDMNALREEALIALDGLKESEEQNVQESLKKLFDNNESRKTIDSISGRFNGLDLFDLEKLTNLPKSLLDDLSWSQGEDTEFFSEGKYKGWPLRILPIHKKPFIKLNGKYYCFNIYSLFDNLYRSLQKLIINRKPDYKEEWNEKQKKMSENVPIDIFKKILPGSTLHTNIYYRWHTKPGGPKEWCETDCLLIYDDHLFIIEIKAGAFTYTSPATDFESHIDSLKNLVLKPSVQGVRFLEYLESELEVSIYNEKHKETGKISKNDFEYKNICAITLDPFTELAAQTYHLKDIGIDVGKHPIWTISIDDLRVYSDIIPGPLEFLHFTEERMRAANNKNIRLEDEFDHFGLYLKHNLYTKYAEQFPDGERVQWFGYRFDIDKVFTEKLYDPSSSCILQQEMPKRMSETLNMLSKSNVAGRRKTASFLLDLGGDWRKNIFDEIDPLLLHQSKTRRIKPLSTYGGMRLTMFCWQQGLIDRNSTFALEHTYTAMLVTNDVTRLLLELIFDTSGNLLDIKHANLHIDDIPPNKLDYLMGEADKMRNDRVEKAKQEHGKIGVNEKCPCGSEKKYKKCCLQKNRH